MSAPAHIEGVPQAMPRIVLRWCSLQGWSRNLLCIALGIGVTLALPPIYFLPLLCISFPALLWMTQSAPRWQRAFWDGWLFGMGNFITGLYWITNALLVDADAFGWLAPFAVVGISAVLSLYIAGVGVVLYHTRHLNVVQRVLIAAMAWCLAEWLRGHLFTGFPWNLLGYVWGFSDVTVQPVAWLGVYGLGMVTVLLAFLPVLWWARNTDAYCYPRRSILGILLCALTLFAMGAMRLPEGPSPVVKDVKVRVVQGNIQQAMKWDPEQRIRNIRTYADLSHAPGMDKVTILVWPESAVTIPFHSGDGLAKELAMLLPERSVLVTGNTRVEGSREQGNLRIYNSLKVLNSAGEIEVAYDKHKLVPFGEFVPFRSILPLDKITPGAIDFSPGPVPSPIAVDGLPMFWPLICYEAVFPDLAGGAHPAWILNITNDAWFGDSTGPYQHFTMTRMRAVEHGVALVRAANTGISAIIDPYGRLIQKLSLNTHGFIDSSLPSALAQPPLYDRFGNVVVWLMMFALGLLMVFQPSRSAS